MLLILNMITTLGVYPTIQAFSEGEKEWFDCTAKNGNACFLVLMVLFSAICFSSFFFPPNGIPASHVFFTAIEATIITDETSKIRLENCINDFCAETVNECPNCWNFQRYCRQGSACSDTSLDNLCGGEESCSGAEKSLFSCQQQCLQMDVIEYANTYGVKREQCPGSVMPC